MCQLKQIDRSRVLFKDEDCFLASRLDMPEFTSKMAKSECIVAFHMVRIRC